ncbi:MAG TPA: hypothetical protein PJ982_20370 [Lacipirellulaceae bacterium]|nr:hypothetical protein [Lacipirellulaceae bacterium]
MSLIMSPEYESLIQAAMLFAAIFALTAVGLALVRRFRGRANRNALDRHEIMANFRDVYERGGLSEEEFRTIKAKLASNLKGDANDARNAG